LSEEERLKIELDELK